MLGESLKQYARRTQSMTFAIIGYGTVGQATRKAAEFLGHECVGVRDKHEVVTQEGGEGATWSDLLSRVDFAFVCVDTPSNPDGSCHTGNVAKALQDLCERDWFGVTVIRSTVPPGFCQQMQHVFPDMTILANPEFLRMRDAESTSRWPDFVVIGCSPAKGGAKWETSPASRALRDFYAPYFEGRVGAPIFCVDWNTAAMVKYASNALIALSIIGAEQLYDVAQAVDADWHAVYSILQNCRVTPKPIRVDPEDRGFGGACLPKDLEALLHHDVDLSLFEQAQAVNNQLRARHE